MARNSTQNAAETTLEGKAPMVHGAVNLPSVTVDDYNCELRDGEGFVGDRARKAVFPEKLEAWRKSLRASGTDPLGDTPTADLSRKQLDNILFGADRQASAIVVGALEDFARELAYVVEKFLKQDKWKGTEKIVVGGGFKQSAIGELAIARASLILKANGNRIELEPIAHHPDDAGLIGAAHLMPGWMLKGHKAIIAIDIGGTNIRVGIVELELKEYPDLSHAHVWKSEIWRHADDQPKRKATIKRLVEMIETAVAQAEKAGKTLAPVIGIACPGLIRPDGLIERGGQNLPGGNWESEAFNLPTTIAEAIGTISGEPVFVIMHNDAVVQGLSQVPFMRDAKSWGVLTIGTGLGNAHFLPRGEE